MPAQLSPATLAVSAFAVATAGFAGGVAISTALSRPVDTGPIIDRNAWNETAPVQPLAQAQFPQPRCNPWEISDAAMEEVLDQMIRRGWRAPTQGTAVALLDKQNIQAIDPNAPMPSRHVWSRSEKTTDEPVAEGDAGDEAEPEPAAPSNNKPPPV